jgi:HTH-type transcriptional regulator/antitoxin HipB
LSENNHVTQFITKIYQYSHDRMKNTTPYTIILGSAIETERKKRGLSQTQLAQLSQTSINFISQVEAGKASAHIGKVLEVLKVLGLQL